MNRPDSGRITDGAARGRPMTTTSCAGADRHSVRRLLEDEGRPMSYREISAAIGSPFEVPAALYVICRRLLHDGLVRRVVVAGTVKYQARQCVLL